MARRTAVSRLKDRVTIQTATDAADAVQQPQQTWADGDSVWAEVVAAGGSEFGQDDTTTQTVAYRVRVRRSSATAAVTARDRLKVTTQDNKILNVVAAAADDNDRRFVVLTCTGAA